MDLNARIQPNKIWAAWPFSDPFTQQSKFLSKNWKNLHSGKLIEKKTLQRKSTRAMNFNFECSDLNLWKEALSSYSSRIESLNKPNLISFDDFYRNQLPPILHNRNPNPYITTTELSKLMQWKLTRGKWRYPLSLFLYIYFNKCMCAYVRECYWLTSIMCEFPGRVCWILFRLWTRP